MGRFIVIDGLDGSGKHTQLESLAAYLESIGKKVRKIDFPHYHTPGCVLVEEYLSGRLGKDPSETNAFAASLFYAMDRYYSFRTDWQKDYEDPDTYLLADRYTTANAVHQTSKLPKEAWDAYLDWLFDTEFNKIGLPRPDDVIYLELPPALSVALVKARSVKDSRAMDIHEKDESFFETSYGTALYASQKFGWTQIACYRQEGETKVMRSIEDIAAEIRRRLGI